MDIEQIDLSRSKRGKDFGQGFYLNANSDQAMEMAVRTTHSSTRAASDLVEELRFKGDHAIQYFFGTPRAVEQNT